MGYLQKLFKTRKAQSKSNVTSDQSTTMSPAQPSAAVLDQLVALISSSVEAIKQEYASKGMDVPSLDSTEPHAMDSLKPTIELKRAVQVLEGACAQLTLSIADPYHTMANRGMGAYELACFRIAVELKIADHLEEAGPSGLSVKELSEKTGINDGKLGRIMRYLATKHVFREVKHDVFINNRLSVRLRSADEMSSLLLHFTDEEVKGSHGLLDNLRHPKYGNSYAPADAPIPRVYGLPDDLDIFAWFNGDAKDRGMRFGRGMVAWGKAASGSLTKAFPWGSLPDGTRIGDVGGGVGDASMELARAFPQLTFTIQDLPATCTQGEELWNKDYPEAVQKKRVEFVPFNFFKEGPVKDCDIYYLRHIIHDWPDKECVVILKGIRASMKANSRVLVHDYILQHVNRVAEHETLIQQAPEPLLPNYGYGRLRMYNLDMDMMVSLNSRERTLDEFIDLGKQADLKFVNVYDTAETGILEFVAA